MEENDQPTSPEERMQERALTALELIAESFARGARALELISAALERISLRDALEDEIAF